MVKVGWSCLCVKIEWIKFAANGNLRMRHKNLKRMGKIEKQLMSSELKVVLSRLLASKSRSSQF